MKSSFLRLKGFFILNKFQSVSKVIKKLEKENVIDEM